MEQQILQVLQSLQHQPQTFSSLLQSTQIEKETLKIILEELDRNNVIYNILFSDEMYFLTSHYPQTNEIQNETYQQKQMEEEQQEILQLHKDILELTKQIEMNERNSKESLNKVHEYNDIKDIGQMLLGKLGQLENKTIMELYEEYNIDLND